MANEIKKSSLYIVATPIGNLSDLSERALKTLREVDFVAAEDTRVSGLLLNHFGIKKPIVNYFEHNKRAAGEKILSELSAGKSCALVTDAGTPGISDPGTELCRDARKSGFSVIPIPGPIAVITALSASGFPSRRFIFEGFLPQDGGKKEVLDSLLHEKRTVVFYDALGDRALCLARELTKLNEDFFDTTLSAAIAHYEQNEPRGEYVLILAGAEETEEVFWKALSIGEHVEFYKNQGLSKMDAIKQCAKDRGVAKNAIYKELL